LAERLSDLKVMTQPPDISLQPTAAGEILSRRG
jgi:hypothetical protein